MEPSQESGITLPAHIETLFKVEPPIRPLPKEHFGFAGVLLRDTKTDTIQCHLCGKWFRSLSSHVMRHHQIPARKYRMQFGLPMGFPMCAKDLSNLISKRMSGPRQRQLLEKHRKKAISRNHGKKFHEGQQYARKNRSFENKKGLCPEQMLRRYLIVADLAGREPSTPDLEKYDSALLSAIKRRFRTLNEYRLHIGARKVEQPKRGATVDDAIASLRRFYFETGAIPTMKKYRGFLPGKTRIYKLFGSWNRAIEAAGIPRGTTSAETNQRLEGARGRDSRPDTTGDGDN